VFFKNELDKIEAAIKALRAEFSELRREYSL
jgi:hypothetical protein